ncbi:TPA: hypothetical protein ACSPJ7_004675 [Bacillus cereus]
MSMNKKKNFLDIPTDEFKAQRSNPFITEKNEQKKTTQATYQTIRIYPEDHRTLKDLSYFENRKMVEIVNEAVAMYKSFFELAKELQVSPATAIQMAIENLKNKE